MSQTIVNNGNGSEQIGTQTLRTFPLMYNTNFKKYKRLDLQN